MNIKKLREKAGMTQGQLAEKMKIRQTTVSNWEMGIAFPRAKQIPCLADILGCSIDALFGRDDSERG